MKGNSFVYIIQKQALFYCSIHQKSFLNNFIFKKKIFHNVGLSSYKQNADGNLKISFVFKFNGACFDINNVYASMFDARKKNLLKVALSLSH